MKLEWVWKAEHPVVEAASAAAPDGFFRIFYDDVMYWDNFSGASPTQDIFSLQAKAQQIHDSHK